MKTCFLGLLINFTLLFTLETNDASESHTPTFLSATEDGTVEILQVIIQSHEKYPTDLIILNNGWTRGSKISEDGSNIYP